VKKIKTKIQLNPHTYKGAHLFIFGINKLKAAYFAGKKLITTKKSKNVNENLKKIKMF